MEQVKCLIVYLVGIMVILHKGDCLNCFSCDSISNRDCAELSFSSDKYVTNCSVTKSGELRESPVCYKATGKVNLMITEGEVGYQRVWR
uniref:Unkown protein n=1 Tax=Riptortus pedestris TaxID=329032 RepID=R4WE18_RIPPE|nr:unkown protein [Riptortus pedestris]